MAMRDRSAFSVAFFFPNYRIDDFDTNKANNERITEQVLGEEVDHLTKMVASCKLNNNLDSLSMVLTFLGNCWIWPQVNWNTAQVRPVFVQCVEKLADALTKPNIHR